jgi:hypothetical protein
MMTSYSKQRRNDSTIYLGTGYFLISIRSASRAILPSTKKQQPVTDTKTPLQVEKPQPRRRRGFCGGRR